MNKSLTCKHSHLVHKHPNYTHCVKSDSLRKIGKGCIPIYCPYYKHSMIRSLLNFLKRKKKK